MLRLRVITAAILAVAVAAAVVYLPDDWLIAFFYVFVFVGCCEWAQLAGVRPVVGRVAFALSLPLALWGATFLLAMTVFSWRYLVVAAVTCWAAATALVLCFPRGSFLLRSTPGLLAAGLVALGGAWVALFGLRLHGVGHVVWLLLAIALADSAAYFAGRRFGRHRLAPAVSPGKTWEGLVGAALAMLACAAGGAWFLGGTLLSWLVVGAAVLVAGVVGDLFVSALKRSRNIKDSGTILPGHGGVLDRIDSLLAAAPVFALLTDATLL